MASGATLLAVRNLLKAFTREASEVSTDTDNNLNALIAATQIELTSVFDWPFMQDKWSKAVSAGGRYVALPTSNIRGIASAIDLHRPLEVRVKYNSDYIELTHGIGFCEWNIHDSNDSETQDPIQKWSLDTNTGDASNADEFEVWPMPSTAQTVYFKGQRQPRAFTSDTHYSDLDGNLIALFCAAEILQLRDLKSAQVLLGRANARLAHLRVGLPCNPLNLVLGANLYSSQPKSRLVSVAVAS